MKLYTKYLTLVLLGAGLALGSCSSSSDDPPPPPPVVEPEPTAYEKALDAINEATTAAAAQAAYDAVDQTAVSGDEAAKLQAALSSKLTMLATAARVAEQKMALANAVDAIDTSDLSTQDAVDAARAAIAALRGLLTGSPDVSDADKAMYQMALDNAVDAVDAAQGGIDTATRRTNQMGALSSASTTLQAALAALSGSTPTQTQLDAANNALTALNSAITDGADLTDDEKAPYQREAANAAAPIQTAQAAKDKADGDATDAANKAMMATAKKLLDGLGKPPGGTGADTRTASYNDADTMIQVTVGEIPLVNLSEDKKATVAALHGWDGKSYTAEIKTDDNAARIGTYEARVYSNVGEPTQGKKFGSTTDNDDYQYTLNAESTTELNVTGVTGYAALVASPSFDQSAGAKSFKKPDNTVKVKISGTFHGVSGTYSCTPTSGNKCAANVATKGFTLGQTADSNNAFTPGGGTWTFKASSNETRVMSAPDEAYASYGWWIKKSADGKTFTASAFHDVKGTVADAAGLDALNGTATYMGGAAGKYALHSTTGGTNDAGHFTARAMLEADFTNNTTETAITGTIDNFIGADGMSRNWSVKLNGSQISDTGAIGNASASTGVDTVWTIDGTAAAKSGNWTGTLRNNGKDSVPQVGTGTFYTKYGDDGTMVGAFGVNKQ